VVSKLTELDAVAKCNLPLVTYLLGRRYETPAPARESFYQGPELEGLTEAGFGEGSPAWSGDGFSCTLRLDDTA
jgi:hypothetical protein